MLLEKDCLEDVFVEIDQELRDEKVEIILQSTPGNSKRRDPLQAEEQKAIFNDSNIEFKSPEKV